MAQGNTRNRLYSRIERIRGRPLVAYFTSSRPNAEGAIAPDVIFELEAQLEALPTGSEALDLLLASRGGDPSTAWRIVSLVRERVRSFSILLPEAAFSAATLIALGADEIVMHPNANLGPLDPQVVTHRVNPDGNTESLSFAFQDVIAFLDLAKQRLGEAGNLTDPLRAVAEEIGAVPLGMGARGSRMATTLAERLLRTHSRPEDEAATSAIAKALSADYFHHGYPLSRTEARQLGLPITDPEAPLAEAMWAVWLDVVRQLAHRQHWDSTAILARTPEAAPLFTPVRQTDAVEGLAHEPVPIRETAVPPVPFEIVTALMESRRQASRQVTRGRILATRLPDLSLRVNVLNEFVGWEDVGEA